MRRAYTWMSVALVATAMLGCAGSGEKKAAVSKPAMSFSSAERDLIAGYYGALRPATQALQGAVKVGDRLAPGSRPQKLPSDLHSKLKALPEPYTWYALGADVILVNRESHEIMDVIPQVVR